MVQGWETSSTFANLQEPIIRVASKYLSIKSSSVSPGLPPLPPFVSFLYLDVPTVPPGKSTVGVFVGIPGAHTFALAVGRLVLGSSRVHVSTSYIWLLHYYFEAGRFHDDCGHSHSYSYNFPREKNQETCVVAPGEVLVWAKKREAAQAQPSA